MDTGAAMKRAFLVCYDYGQGGVWAFVKARSANEIEKSAPDLKVFNRRPRWMTSQHMARLEKTMSFDIDKPRGFLATVLSHRPKTANRLLTPRESEVLSF